MNRTWQASVSAMAAVLCAASVACSAYASHGLEGDAQRRMMTATYFAFAHGVSLIVLVRTATGRSHFLACALMLLGVFLFSGSLACAAVWKTSTALAPSGGIALISAWCWIAFNFLFGRRQ